MRPAAATASASSFSLSPMLISAWCAAVAYTKVSMASFRSPSRLGCKERIVWPFWQWVTTPSQLMNHLTKLPLRKIATISTRRFDARFRRPSERTSKSTDFPRRISSPNQRLKNPYCLGEVRSFGEKGRRESDFGPSGRLQGQQLSGQKRAFPDVFRAPGSAERSSWPVRLAEGTEPGSNRLLCDFNGLRCTLTGCLVCRRGYGSGLDQARAALRSSALRNGQ